jgi:EAL domain-containing protein (putative c-di-GMP-specific phosphodiesterase class I)
MRSADVALYNAKRSGRNRIGHVAGASVVGIGSKSRLVTDLRAALTAGGEGLSLVMQPLRRGTDGRTISGYEVLVRWTHPVFGPVAPNDFVPVAERSGLASALDGWVLNAACRTAAQFPTPRPVVAVNITPSFLISPDFLHAVDQALHDSGLPPQSLCIELTERVFLEDLEPARAVTAALIARGVQVALDDFGSGHASFGYLTDVSVSKLKVDRSLIGALGQSDEQGARAAAIIRGVIAMARELGLRVVAEGVETADQMRVLQAFGTDELQGWHLGHPAPATRWLTAEETHARAAA